MWAFTCITYEGQRSEDVFATTEKIEIVEVKRANLEVSLFIKSFLSFSHLSPSSLTAHYIAAG